MALTFTNTSRLGSSSILSLSRSQTAFAKSFALLSSGKRINSAADDPAGLAIASGLAASITQVSQRARNVTETASALTVADGALGQVSEVTTRLKELATTAANGTYTDQQREAFQTEYSALSSEIQRIGETTNFNGKQLLDGSTISTHIGAGGETLQIGGINLQSLSSSIASQDISTQAGAQNALAALQQFSQDLEAQRGGSIDSALARLDSVYNSLGSQRLTQSEALSRLQDADISSTIPEALRTKVLQ